MGYEPWIKEYDSDRPIAQYIISTNIRRNLTKAQRHQLIADFATEIIPQIDAEMKKRMIEAGRAGGRGNIKGREDSPDPFLTDHPGREVFAKETGATIAEAKAVKSIHDKAPELLGEVAQRGGLAPTEKEARRRAEEKEQKEKKKETETLRRESSCSSLP